MYIFSIDDLNMCNQAYQYALLYHLKEKEMKGNES